MIESDAEISIIRLLRADRKRVWDLWTNPAEFPHWHHPRGFITPIESISIDLRIGGTYAYTLINTRTGARFATVGVYLDIVPLERLVFTWGDPDTPTAKAPVASVDLRESQGQTEMTFRLRRLETIPSDADVQTGWSEAIGNLETRINATQ
ncbi:SRPBCC family protein [Rhizobium herbae]